MDTGGGIAKATPRFKDSKAVLVHNVDIISDVSLKKLGEEFLASDDDAWLLTQDRETNRKLLFDTENQLVGWMNKSENRYKWVDESKLGVSTSSTTFNAMAFSGLHFFRSDLFSEFECKPQSVIDLYLTLAKTKRIVSVHIHPKFWFDLGKPEQLQNAENQLNHKS
jgi:NDP-sugar pyrophosphorylase family protein